MFPHNFFTEPRTDIDGDLDTIFNTIDEWMLAGKWDQVQDTFRVLCEYDYVDQVEGDGMTFLGGFLTISLAGKEHIGHWREVAVKRIRTALERIDHPETEALLSGLE